MRFFFLFCLLYSVTINNCWGGGGEGVEGIIMFPAYHFEPSLGNNGFLENGMLQIPEQLQCED